MSPLPKPLSLKAQDTGMPRRRQKSGLRTAAGALQEQFLERLGRLAEDPLQALARSLGDEPRPLARLRRQLATLKEGKVPLAARFDAHVLGAVYRALLLSTWDAVPRLMDAKVAGQRRFYLQRGQVARICSLGVQNFDQPRVLLLAYATMAKRHHLHFFALPDGVVCTGKAATPPPEWFANVGGEAVALASEALDQYGCGHPDRDRVVLQLEGGPSMACCAPCGQRLEGRLHGRVRERYLGPRQKKPVEIQVRRADGGATLEPTREAMARYRAGIATEADVIRSAL